jgi:hypothetical protein
MAETIAEDIVSAAVQGRRPSPESQQTTIEAQERTISRYADLTLFHLLFLTFKGLCAKMYVVDQKSVVNRNEILCLTPHRLELLSIETEQLQIERATFEKQRTVASLEFAIVMCRD